MAREFVHTFREIETQRSATAEAQWLYSRYPDAVMGVGAETDYLMTLARVQNQFQGNRLQFDPAAWMEFAKVEGGRAEKVSLVFLADCRVRHWILPAQGEPFSMRNWYGEMPFFTSAFRAKFHEQYTIVATTKYYTVWARKSLT